MSVVIPDDRATLHRFLAATSSAIDARSFDVARVNAALTVAAAVRVMDAAGLEASPTTAFLSAESDQIIVALARRGTIPLDLAADFSRLLARCRSRVLSRTAYPEAREAARLASSAVELALGSKPTGVPGRGTRRFRPPHSS